MHAFTSYPIGATTYSHTVGATTGCPAVQPLLPPFWPRPPEEAEASQRPGLHLGMVAMHKVKIKAWSCIITCQGTPEPWHEL